MDWNSLRSDDPNLRFARYSERYFPAADDLVTKYGVLNATRSLADMP